MAESFLEGEIEYLTSAFDKVIVLTRDVTSVGRRKPNSDLVVYRLNPESNLREKLHSLALYFRNRTKVAAFLREERKFIHSKYGRIPAAIIKKMVHDLTKALITANHLESIIRKENLKNVTLYSYWLTSSALSTAFVSAPGVEITRLSRAHGGDVYETRNPLKYLSFRKTLIKELDAVFTISEDAKKHLEMYTGSLESNIKVSRLGTHRMESDSPMKPPGNTFHIVSCSFLVPVKRVHLLIEALATINAQNIRWTHIGDGPLMKEITDLAQVKLGHKTNVQFSFPGALPNETLMDFYRQNWVDLFVNTSSSEGIPVTMMEAQSFGIPIVAPAVGGIPEIVSSETGRLFPVDASPADIAGVITSVLMLDQEAVTAMRGNAFRNWSLKYNAERNFPTFVAEIAGLKSSEFRRS
jgi:glycosyltransferase involved in cell wall biosynthesis